MVLDVFLMDMFVVVIVLLIRREMKLKKARQIMQTQIFKEKYIPNVHAITLLLMLLLSLWLPLALRFLLIIQSNKLVNIITNKLSYITILSKLLQTKNYPILSSVRSNKTRKLLISFDKQPLNNKDTKNKNYIKQQAKCFGSNLH